MGTGHLVPRFRLRIPVAHVLPDGGTGKTVAVPRAGRDAPDHSRQQHVPSRWQVGELNEVDTPFFEHDGIHASIAKLPQLPKAALYPQTFKDTLTFTEAHQFKPNNRLGGTGGHSRSSGFGRTWDGLGSSSATAMGSSASAPQLCANAKSIGEEDAVKQLVDLVDMVDPDPVQSPSVAQIQHERPPALATRAVRPEWRRPSGRPAPCSAEQPLGRSKSEARLQPPVALQPSNDESKLQSTLRPFEQLAVETIEDHNQEAAQLRNRQRRKTRRTANSGSPNKALSRSHRRLPTPLTAASLIEESIPEQAAIGSGSQPGTPVARTSPSQPRTPQLPRLASPKKPRLPTVEKVWEGRSRRLVVRDLFDGYAADPLGFSPPMRGGAGHSSPLRGGIVTTPNGRRPGSSVRPGSSRPGSSMRPSSSYSFLAVYVERQAEIERLLQKRRGLHGAH